MLCERCKMREANIRFTEMVNGVVSEHNLCSQCAKEIDFGQYTGLTGLFDSDYPIGKLLSQILGVGGGSTPSDEAELENLVCPTCHTSYGDFVKNSRFGCPDCYHMFDLLISDKLKQLHGSDTHTGKHAGQEPAESAESLMEKPLSGEEQIELLRSLLKDAVAEEDFESAAKLRDQIRALEKAENEKAEKEASEETAEEAPAEEAPEEEGSEDTGPGDPQDPAKPEEASGEDPEEEGDGES